MERDKKSEVPLKVNVIKQQKKQEKISGLQRRSDVWSQESEARCHEPEFGT